MKCDYCTRDASWIIDSSPSQRVCATHLSHDTVGTTDTAYGVIHD